MSSNRGDRIYMKRITVIIILCMCGNKIFSQQPSTSHWTTIQSPVMINTHWQTITEASYRTLGESVKLNQLFLRAGARYNFNPKWNVSLSMDYVHSRVKPFDKDDLEFGNELRIWQEVNHRTPLKKSYTLHHRFRIEERFFGITSQNQDYRALRGRYRIGAVKKIATKWDLQLIEEYVEQLLDRRISFNQNRLALSGFFRYSTNAHLEAAYYWVKYAKSTQHVFSLTFQNRILVKSKKKVNG